jgi:AAA+ superfamily predicted ATPase
MARADLLLSLVKAATSEDREALRRVLEAMAAEERGKHHNVLADRIQRELLTLDSENSPPNRPRAMARSERGIAVLEREPRSRSLKELILREDVEDACLRFIEEQRRADLLRSHGLEPRHRVLLAGPPGNGKTSLAEVLASELVAPLLSVRYETLITSYLGETSTRLHEVFEFARTRRCLLFFDEFDTIGKERGDEHETGEIKRVVSSLLLQIDELPSYVVVVVATNHPELLDRAVWRRFELRLSLDTPTLQLREAWFERMAATGVDVGMSPAALAAKFPEASFSELEDFTLDLLRRQVLAPPGTNARTLASELIAERRGWFKTPTSDGNGQ